MGRINLPLWTKRILFLQVAATTFRAIPVFVLEIYVYMLLLLGQVFTF